jgi:hypothetical protein
MPQAIPPSTTLELDKPRKWQFDMNAVIALHQALGPKAFERLSALKPSEEEDQEQALAFDADRFEVYRALLWCGLISEDPTLTLQQVGAMATPFTAVRLIVPALESMNKALSDPTLAAVAQAATPQA